MLDSKRYATLITGEKCVNRIIFTLYLFLFSVGAAAEKYLCIASSSTGYVYDKIKNEWNISEFKADYKYIIYKDESDTLGKWRVKKFDGSHIAVCKNDFGSIGKLYCSGTSEFKMNKYNGRFIRSQTFGYWDDGLNDIINKTDKMELNPFYDVVSEEGDTNPFIQIGECTSI